MWPLWVRIWRLLVLVDRTERTVSNRTRELQSVATDQRDGWLAGQLDEIHDEMKAGFDELRTEIRAISESQAQARTIWIGFLISLVVGVIVTTMSFVYAANAFAP